MKETILTDVGRRPAVLHVTVTLSSDMTRNTDGCTTVSNTVREGANAGSLVLASETELVVLAVDGNVVHVFLGELLDGLFDSLDTALLAHGLGGEVRVASSTVPVTLEWLRVE